MTQKEGQEGQAALKQLVLGGTTVVFLPIPYLPGLPSGSFLGSWNSLKVDEGKLKISNSFVIPLNIPEKSQKEGQQDQEEVLEPGGGPP